MKHVITTYAFTFLLPLSVHAKILTPANTLKVNSPDGLTQISELTAKFGIVCTYRSGIFWPENHSCGVKNYELPVSADGIVNIPEVETFTGLHGNNANNYDLSLSIYEGKQYLGVMSAYGIDAIAAMAINSKNLNILRFKGASLSVSKDGSNFFGSELALNENAYMLISIRPTTVENKIGEIMVSSSMEGYLESLENKFPYPGKKLLKDAIELKIPDTSLAYLGDQNDIKLKIRLSVDLNEAGSHVEKTKAEITIPATNLALPELANIELK